MEQLPPKVPNMAEEWHVIDGHQRNSPMGSFLPSSIDDDNSSWVDEFLNFSSERNTHRRSVSDSITLLDAELNVDDDQLTSIFCDEFPSPSMPSDLTEHNCIYDDKPDTPSPNAIGIEGQNTFNVDALVSNEGPVFEQIADPKRLRRILANRQSAQRSRVRKLQYITDLERSVTNLQTKVSALSPRVAFLDHQRSVLTYGNGALRQRIAALAQDKIFKDAHQEALKKEVERLRQVHTISRA